MGKEGEIVVARTIKRNLEGDFVFKKLREYSERRFKGKRKIDISIHYKGKYYEGVEYNIALLYMKKIINGTITDEEHEEILSGKISLVYTVRSAEALKLLVGG